MKHSKGQLLNFLHDIKLNKMFMMFLEASLHSVYNKNTYTERLLFTHESFTSFFIQNNNFTIFLFCHFWNHNFTFFFYLSMIVSLTSVNQITPPQKINP